MKVDYTLYLCTDSGLMSCATVEESVEKAVLGGCSVVQLREKTASSLELFQLAQRVKRVTDKYGVPLISARRWTLREFTWVSLTCPAR